MCFCAALDVVVRMGRTLKDKSPKADDTAFHDAVVHVKAKWTALCTKALDRYKAVTLLLLLIFVQCSSNDTSI
jgi:hypothetical protein